MRLTAMLVLVLIACKPPAPVRLALIGDTGTGDSGQLDVAAALELACQDLGCDAVLMLGDNFYPSGVDAANDGQWAVKFDAPYAAIEVPFFAVLGNHDYGGLGLAYEIERASAQVAVGTNGGKFVMPSHFYSRSIRQVDLFALDTTAILFGDDADQRVAVRQWLKQSTGRWRIAYGHHPYWSSGTHGDAGVFDGLTVNPYAGETWRRFFDEELCGKIDLYVSGHDHDLQWLAAPATCNAELIVSGGGGAAPRPVSEAHESRYLRSARGFFWLELDADSAQGSAFELGAAPVEVHAWRK